MDAKGDLKRVFSKDLSNPEDLGVGKQVSQMRLSASGHAH